MRSRFSDFEDSRSAFNRDLFFIFIFFPLIGSSWIRGSFSSLLRSYLASFEKSVRFFAHVSSKIFCNTTQAFRASVC